MLKLNVSGMTCDHCVAAVARAIRSVPRVEDVAVSLERGEVIVDGTPDERAVREAIAEEGYEVRGAA